MSGCALKDAIDVVDNAAAIVVCLSKDFVDDLASRTIVAMATKLNVPLIPVVMEVNSIAGWIEEALPQ